MSSFRDLTVTKSRLQLSKPDLVDFHVGEQEAPTMEEDRSYCSARSMESRHYEEQFDAVRRILSFTDEDMIRIVDERESFQELQKALRNKGCVTNMYLQQNMHLYVYHWKHDRASRQEQAGIQ